MILINPQLEAHKSPAGTLIGKAEELLTYYKIDSIAIVNKVLN